MLSLHLLTPPEESSFGIKILLCQQEDKILLKVLSSDNYEMALLKIPDKAPKAIQDLRIIGDNVLLNSTREKIVKALLSKSSSLGIQRWKLAREIYNLST